MVTVLIMVGETELVPSSSSLMWFPSLSGALLRMGEGVGEGPGLGSPVGSGLVGNSRKQLLA
jgi:hypothetical protein